MSSNMQPQNKEHITIMCMFTREWLVDRWIADLEHALKFADYSVLHAAFVVDLDSMYITTKLRGLQDRHAWASFELEMNRDHNPNEVNIGVRRKRIAEVKNQSKEIIARHQSEWVLALEDDSAFDHLDCFCRLRQGYRDLDAPVAEGEEQPQPIGLISGVEAGRWNMKYVGAWSFDDVMEPSKAYTIKPQFPNTSESFERFTVPADQAYQEVDATGFYAYLTPTKLYLEHEYYWNDNQPWGPDVNYGLWLRQKGYRVFIDWGTAIGHNNHNRIIEVFDGSPILSVCYNRNRDKPGLEDTWYRDDEQSPA